MTELHEYQNDMNVLKHLYTKKEQTDKQITYYIIEQQNIELKLKLDEERREHRELYDMIKKENIYEKSISQVVKEEMEILRAENQRLKMANYALDEENKKLKNT